MGTQVTTLALVRALAEHGGGAELRVRVALPPNPGEHAREALAELDVELVGMDGGGVRSDVVHRPSQVVAPVNLDWLRRLGERIVITHQDLIAYSNPGYFGSPEEWEEHRLLSRQSLALADAAVFISQYVRDEALAEELAPAERAVVVAQGVDHAMATGPVSRPDGVPAGEFLVLLGADFRHKNRVFALRLMRALIARGWDGALVLAGPRMPHGSSRAEEDAELAADPELARRVVRLGAVSQPEAAWLYANAALALYPTVSEGFGLVPFEAAAAGTACMFAPVSSLAEVLGPEHATLVPWDADAGADRALALLRDEGERRRLAAAVAAHGRRYAWADTAARLADVYRHVAGRPARPARLALVGSEQLTEVAGALVGPGGRLPADVQRALLAISTRPALRGPAFAALRASYKALKRARHDSE
jgi:glycosyltransferase involved in cell wall biosynthesis